MTIAEFYQQIYYQNPPKDSAPSDGSECLRDLPI